MLIADLFDFSNQLILGPQLQLAPIFDVPFHVKTGGPLLLSNILLSNRLLVGRYLHPEKPCVVALNELGWRESAHGVALIDHEALVAKGLLLSRLFAHIEAEGFHSFEVN